MFLVTSSLHSQGGESKLHARGITLVVSGTSSPRTSSLVADDKSAACVTITCCKLDFVQYLEPVALPVNHIIVPFKCMPQPSQVSDLVRISLGTSTVNVAIKPVHVTVQSLRNFYQHMIVS